MPEKTKVEYHKYDNCFGGSPEKPAHRAMITFAPGPYGTLFTDAYTGRRGAEMAVEKFLSFLNPHEIEIKN
jgi:hypothetical protein